MWSDPAIVTAFVTGITSLLVTGINFFLNQIKSERNSRRQYEYSARKRLYDEFEPLSFQLVEYSEVAARRIRALAREANRGYLQLGWYSNLNSCHMHNAIYRLLAPLVAFRIMQRRLTSFDLTLDKSVKIRYLLGKVLYYSFTHDVRLAKILAELTPNRSDGYDPWKGSPRQGIYHQSSMDGMIDALIFKDSDNAIRVMTFTEFENKFSKQGIDGPFSIMGDLLLNFHPKTRPILWTILIAQVHIYRAIKEIQDHGFHERNKPVKNIPENERLRDFDWRQQKDEASDEEVIEKPFMAVEKYLKENWTELLGRTN